MDLSGQRCITPPILSGIIRRQPVSLNLGFTNISKKQLMWLLSRLQGTFTHTHTLSKPTYTSHLSLFRIQTVCVSGLLELNVSGCPWNVVSGLCQVQCPCLQRLDLSKVEDLKDTQLKELLATPHLAQGASGVPTSRFQKLLELGLAGTELTDASARLLIGHVPALKRLDLSHCGNISDQMLLTLTSPTSPLRERLTHISLAGRRGQWGWSHSSENHKLSHFTDSGRSLSYNSH